MFIFDLLIEMSMTISK